MAFGRCWAGALPAFTRILCLRDWREFEPRLGRDIGLGVVDQDDGVLPDLARDQSPAPNVGVGAILANLIGLAEVQEPVSPYGRWCRASHDGPR